MSSINDPLYQGEHICLAPPDPEKDAEIETKWTHDGDYLRNLSLEPARPVSPAQLKKRYEAAEKDAEEGRNLFLFTLRLREDDRLIGFARIEQIEWTHGNAYLRLGIGEAAERGKGYGSEALRLLLRFAFAELNLHHLAAVIPETNTAALRLFQGAGFIVEARRRQAVNRGGQVCDRLHLGLLREEWIRGA